MEQAVLGFDQAKAYRRINAQLKQMEMTLGKLQEYEKLRVLCAFHKLHPADRSVYNLTTKDTAWEIVDFNLNQIYRSDLIFKMGNYSIEDYETYSPWELFNRPHTVLSHLVELTMNLKTSDSVVSLEHIPDYVIEETKTITRTQYRVRHKFACPLVCPIENKNVAFVSAFEFETLDPRNRVSIL